jgi:hypothetical protein
LVRRIQIVRRLRRFAQMTGQINLRNLRHGPERCWKFCFFAKKSLFAVDGVFSTATLLTPPEAGLT